MTTFNNMTATTEKPISELSSGSEAIIIMFSQSSNHLQAMMNQSIFEYLDLPDSKEREWFRESLLGQE